MEKQLQVCVIKKNIRYVLLDSLAAMYDGHPIKNETFYIAQ